MSLMGKHSGMKIKKQIIAKKEHSIDKRTEERREGKEYEVRKATKGTKKKKKR